MSGFPPEKPIETITEEKRAEEEDDQNDPEEETLTGPLDLSDSNLNLREDTYSYPQQEFRDDYRPIAVSGFTASCSAINEVNKDSCSSSSSRIKSEDYNKPKEHDNKEHFFKQCQKMNFSDFERSQMESLFGFLGLVQNPNPSSVTQPREESQIPSTLESLGFVEETDNSSLGLVQNQNPSSVTQPREENLGLGTSLVDRNDQTLNQQIILPNHGSSATSHHQSNLNLHAPSYIPRNRYQQQQFPLVHQIPNQQQQFTIPNHGSISSATSDQNQPFGRHQQLNPSASPPWNPQWRVVNQMITSGPAFERRNHFNHNISASNQVPQHIPGPETNQQDQLIYNQYYQRRDLRSGQNIAPSGLDPIGLPHPAAQQWLEQNQLRFGLDPNGLPDLADELAAQRRFERFQQFLVQRSGQRRFGRYQQFQTQQRTQSQGQGFDAGPSSDQQ